MTSRHTFVVERIRKTMRQRPSMDKQDAHRYCGQVMCLALIREEQIVDALGSDEAVGSDAS